MLMPAQEFGEWFFPTVLLAAVAWRILLDVKADVGQQGVVCPTCGLGVSAGRETCGERLWRSEGPAAEWPIREPVEAGRSVVEERPREQSEARVEEEEGEEFMPGYRAWRAEKQIQRRFLS